MAVGGAKPGCRGAPLLWRPPECVIPERCSSPLSVRQQQQSETSSSPRAASCSVSSSVCPSSSWCGQAAAESSGSRWCSRPRVALDCANYLRIPCVPKFARLNQSEREDQRRSGRPQAAPLLWEGGAGAAAASLLPRRNISRPADRPWSARFLIGEAHRVWPPLVQTPSEKASESE